MISSTWQSADPVTGSAWQPGRPGQPRPLAAGTLALVTLPTSPFWARRYTRFFLGSCRGIGAETAETAELLVSELVTNAVRAADKVVAAGQVAGSRRRRAWSRSLSYLASRRVAAMSVAAVLADDPKLGVTEGGQVGGTVWQRGLWRRPHAG